MTISSSYGLGFSSGGRGGWSTVPSDGDDVANTLDELLSGGGGRRKPPPISPEEEEAYINKIGRMTGSAIESIGYALDTPGAAARGILAGDPLSVFGDSDRRVSGKELNEAYGLTNKEDNPWLSTALGLATEIGTDPLAWVSLPMSSLTKSGKAAKAAGLLDLAPIAAQKKLGVTESAKTLTGRFTSNAYDNLLERGLARTPENYAVRPLLGPRYARTQATLADVVQSADNPQAALDEVLKYLKTTGGNYDDIKDEALGGAFGLGFWSPSAVFTPKGSEKYLDALDALGQRIAWSKPARIASAYFDKDVAGFTDAADQMSAMRQSAAVKSAAAEGRRLATQHALILGDIPVSDEAAELLGANTLLSKEGNDFLTRMFEGKPRGADAQIRAALPGIDRLEQSWDDIRRFNVERAKELGMRVNPYSDQYGTLYSPRRAAELEFGDFGRGAGRSVFNANTTEGYSRRKYLITPGGTDDLRQASLLPEVREYITGGPNSQTMNDEMIGQRVADFLNARNGTDAVTADQGTAITKALKRINNDLPSDYPVFAEHPIAAQARNIVNQEMAAANAKFIYESMAEVAVNQRNTSIMGGNFKRLDTALNEISNRTGLKVNTGSEASQAVRQNLINRIARRTGVDPSRIDLSQMALPEQVYNRMMRMQDFYSSPKAQEEVANAFNKFTSATKAFLLAWPSRHVRDMYSNLFASWLETGSPTATWQGFTAASAIVAGRFDDAIPYLRQLPQYANLADSAAIRNQFMQDAARGGVLSTLATSDLLTATRRGDINQLIPGSTPMTRLGSFKEMIPDGSRTPLQMLEDFTQIRNVTNKWETRNPVLNWSTKLSDTNDSIARLGTFVALMKQGVTVDEAAKRTSKALVDYSSLTPVERHTFRNIFPWWAYNSRIGKYVVDQLISKPGGQMSQVIRGMNTLQASDEGRNIPTALRQQFAVRVPDALNPFAGRADVTTYLTDFDFPGIDILNMYKPGSLQDTVGEVANQMHPLGRTFAELAMNRDFFSKRPLDESTTRADRLYQALRGAMGSPTKAGLPVLAKAIINNIPGGQRPINFFGGLVDDRIPDFGQRLVKESINATLGVKVRDVDPNWEYQDLMRKLGERQRGWSRSTTITGIPDELFPEAPPEVQKASLVQKSQTSKHNRERAKKEKEQEAKAMLLKVGVK